MTTAIGVTVGSSSFCSRRRISYSRSATWRVISFMAYTSSPTCTNRTTWREMPRGRLASRSSGQVAKGLCQGSVNIFGFELAAVIFSACGSAESACSSSALTDVAFSARGSIWGNSFNSMCSILRGAWEVRSLATTSARYVYGKTPFGLSLRPSRRQKEKPRSYAGLFQRGHKRGRE